MTAVPDTKHSPPSARTEWRFPVAIALLALAVTMLPYLIGASFAGNRRFMWLGYNLDDSCVYLSWMRQAADGQSRAFNLFTTDPQNGMALNPLFWILGRFAGVTGLPLLAVYHAARLVFGFGLLLLIWQLIRVTIASSFARRLSILFAAFSAGLGWLPFWWNDAPFATPIDKWQPEAITFLSLMLSPLFCFSLALQVGILLLLYTGEQRNSLRHAIAAGFCALLLALVHTYDVITIAAIWFVYLLVSTFRPIRRTDADLPRAQSPSPSSPLSSWLRGIVAGIIASPGVLYIAYQLSHESVFRERANVPTLSPSLIWILLGYGLTFLFALAGIFTANKRVPGANSQEGTAAQPIANPDTRQSPAPYSPVSTRLLIVWLLANIAVSYLPVPFQRKMLQGAHIPIALLAGIGAATLFQQRLKTPRLQSLAMVGLTLLLCVTNVRFLFREIDNDVRNRVQSGLERAYLNPGELEALDWIKASTPADAPIQPLPWVALSPDGRSGSTDITLACFTPGLIHRHVYCGHWGETPNFGPTMTEGRMTDTGKFIEVGNLARPQMSDEQRIALLRKMKVRYLVFSQKASDDTAADQLAPMFRNLAPLPPYLKMVHTNPDADVYEVDSSVWNQSAVSAP